MTDQPNEKTNKKRLIFTIVYVVSGSMLLPFLPFYKIIDPITYLVVVIAFVFGFIYSWHNSYETLKPGEMHE